MLQTIRFSFLALTVAVVNAQSSAWIQPSLLTCDLECVNDGYCTLVEGTTEELTRASQSGHLIEKCVCPPGFSGLACEQTVDECTFPERQCHNGAPCTQNDLGEWGCDCSSAYEMSAFAGRQCKNPVTEYCTGKYDPYAALSFCTNGGRCVSDFLAAEISPGDTAFDSAFT